MNTSLQVTVLFLSVFALISLNEVNGSSIFDKVKDALDGNKDEANVEQKPVLNQQPELNNSNDATNDTTLEKIGEKAKKPVKELANIIVEQIVDDHVKGLGPLNGVTKKLIKSKSHKMIESQVGKLIDSATDDKEPEKQQVEPEHKRKKRSLDLTDQQLMRMQQEHEQASKKGAFADKLKKGVSKIKTFFSKKFTKKNKHANLGPVSDHGTHASGPSAYQDDHLTFDDSQLSKEYLHNEQSVDKDHHHENNNHHDDDDSHHDDHDDHRHEDHDDHRHEDHDDHRREDHDDHRHEDHDDHRHEEHDDHRHEDHDDHRHEDHDDHRHEDHDDHRHEDHDDHDDYNDHNNDNDNYNQNNHYEHREHNHEHQGQYQQQAYQDMSPMDQHHNYDRRDLGYQLDNFQANY